MRPITTTLESTEFMKGLSKEGNKSEHWLNAKEAMDRPWTSTRAECDAARAFRRALLADDLLLD